MFCLSCTEPSRSSLCGRCVAELRPAPELILDGGLLVTAAFMHAGTARRLVHALKYRGVTAAAMPFAVELAPRLPASTTMLVPLPRAWARATRYGVDPAHVLARGVGRLTGIPVVAALGSPLWWRRHAGAARSDRTPIRFRVRVATPPGAVLVDDVVTTGVTAASAAVVLGGVPTLVLAATVVPRVVSRETPVEVA